MGEAFKYEDFGFQKLKNMVQYFGEPIKIKFLTKNTPILCLNNFEEWNAKQYQAWNVEYSNNQQSFA